MKNQIDPTAVIGPDVSMGYGNKIGPYTVILGRVKIGNNNWFGPHVVIGTPPEHKELRFSTALSLDGRVDIGSDNIIHEFTSIQSSIELSTTLGDKNFVMNKTHIGHDCRIGNDVIISSGSLIGGHVIIEDLANIGLGAIIRQRLCISTLSMVGMGAIITKNHPPYSTLVGVPAKIMDVNKIGLDRAGIEISHSQLLILSKAIQDRDLSLIHKLPPVISQTLIDYFNL